jgi:hypothetical protein
MGLKHSPSPPRQVGRKTTMRLQNRQYCGFAEQQEWCVFYSKVSSHGPTACFVGASRTPSWSPGWARGTRDTSGFSSWSAAPHTPRTRTGDRMGASKHRLWTVAGHWTIAAGLVS